MNIDLNMCLALRRSVSRLVPFLLDRFVHFHLRSKTVVLVRPQNLCCRSELKTNICNKKDKKEKTYFETNLLKPRHMFKANILFHLRPPNSVPKLAFLNVFGLPLQTLVEFLQHICGAILKWSTIISVRNSAQAQVFPVVGVFSSLWTWLNWHVYNPRPTIKYMSANPVLQLKV